MPTPFGFLPERKIATKLASLYLRATKPVVGSGVKFDALVVPHGPVHAVRSRAVWISPAVVEGTDVVAGRPLSGRVSSTWPAASFLGEWQSWQPVILTRYLPRSTADAAPPLVTWPADWDIDMKMPNTIAKAQTAQEEPNRVFIETPPGINEMF